MSLKCNVIECEIYDAISKIKSKYVSVFIISLHKKPKLFSELEEEFSYISSMQVSRTLKSLSKNKLIHFSEGTYSLSEHGEDLFKILNELNEWNINLSK